MNIKKTYSIKPADIQRKWYLIDASSANLGQVATSTAKLLSGKAKPQFSHHIDCGDFVVVINAAKLKVSGNKLTDKLYYRHSGYPGGLKIRSLEEQLKYDPTQVIIHAVRGMLPDNKLRNERLGRLKVYSSDDHPHAPQQPEPLNITKGKAHK